MSTNTKRDPASSALPSDGPTRVGRYQLVYELAAGGMAVVYLAKAEGAAGFEKLVALKRIHPHLAREQDFIHMFLDEARIASRINHPNVCSVFDFGEADGSYYIAMEYVAGETLARVARRLARDRTELLKPETVGFACKIVADACDGLHAAHELRGEGGALLEVVHRDVSPQNLFVAYDGTVRVVDFGIARAAGRLHETRTGTVKGKLAYMAPEQGKKLLLDRRADVWALGCVLWELLSGQRIFKRETEVDTILAVLSDPIAEPSAIRADIPKELDRIVMKALSRDRDQRYATARDFARDLHRFLAKLEEPVTSGEIADWMAHLFPEVRRERLALAEKARTSRGGGVLRVSGLLLDEASRSAVRPAEPGAQAASDAPTTSEEGNETVQLTESEVVMEPANAADPTALHAAAPAPTPTPAKVQPAVAPRPLVVQPAQLPSAPVSVAPRPSGRRTAVAVSVAGLVAVGLIVLGAATLGGDEEEPPPRARTPTAAEPSSEAPAEATPEAQSALEEPVVAEPAPPPDVEEEPVVVEATPPDDTVEEAPAGAVERTPAGAARTIRRFPPPRRDSRGQLDIATPGGWADVFENGRSIGRAPGRVELAAGRHLLVLHPFGRAADARRVAVTVPSGAARRVIVDLR